MTVSTLSILFFRAWSIQALFWLEWAYSDLINSVIPTGGDHRKGDDLWSGWTCCFAEALSEVEGDLLFSCVSERAPRFLFSEWVQFPKYS